ncbi:2'-5' RNA ligase family protein [Dyadobacter sandarakinus]|uniref:2'-5' RNA ligase family protein n=1 Tax=Dyadobacter sandarakinus TaxID=2747268 RepID=A0ABX7I8G0_9BACT|nr:2'-5' RNA ligase family protein [Dyadobacter sandarakinus]QRR01266.1 2'-5' RNA ligase family protein [Dyadobacter sandarakinus]
MKSVHVNNNHLNTLTNIRHHMFEYQLVFSCDTVTEAVIHNVKRYFEDNYGCRNAAKRKAHLTLFDCIMHENKVDPMIKAFGKVAGQVSPFTMQLTRYAKYENGTFYIDLEDTASQSVLDMVKILKREAGEHVRKWAPAENRFCTDPNYTIARNMTESQMSLATRDWYNREFNMEFKVNEMLLLRRSLVKGSPFETVAKFPLLGMPAKRLVQTSIFGEMC